MRIFESVTLLAFCASGLIASPYQVTIDTSALSGGDYQAYFALVGSKGNIVTASSFSLGGGTALLPVVTGTGDLDTSVTLDNTPPANQFFVEFAQNFTAGSTLRFILNLTDNGPTLPDPPDAFSFALATTGNLNLDTNDPSGADYLFTVDLTGGPLNFQTFTTAGTEITAVIEPVSVPEPAFGAAVAGLLAAIAGVRRLRRAS
jgi:hypothetical protein